MEVLIIGQGLAGSVLALTLLQRGHEVLLVDRNEALTSSKVAAGIFNPITGMNRSKTWKAEELFPFLRTFYKSAMQQLGGTFYKEMPIYMPFATLESQNEWCAKSAESYWKQWMHISTADELFSAYVKNPYGAMETLQSGWVDTPAFLEKVASYLLKRKALIYEEFDNSHIQVKDKVQYKDKHYDAIVYCDGISAAHNPFFSWLNHAHVKGDLFEAEIEGLPPTHIINKNGFILPIGAGRYRVGSTYNNFFNDYVSVTNEGYTELHQKLENILSTPFTIIRHYAATRPATKDRRPLLGAHPKYGNVMLFNGLGTKGVSLAPYLANHLADFIEGKAQIMPDVTLERCIKYFTNEHQNV